jgi:hypothetical protein
MECRVGARRRRREDGAAGLSSAMRPEVDEESGYGTRRACRAAVCWCREGVQ